MDLTALNGYSFRGLGTKNLILGKNGCGKSRALKLAEQALRRREGLGAVRYLSPERAGLLQYQPHIESDMGSSPDWLSDMRRRNQAANFREQSAVQFRKLELLTLREIEKDKAKRSNPDETFDTTVDRINTLLDRVYISRGDPTFLVRDRTTDDVVEVTEISSGESELISLGIECLVFAHECIPDKNNVLLIDEPDVHLHPDLQARFARFLEDLIDEGRFILVGATHSTSFLGAMREDDQTRVAFMRYRETDIRFTPITDTHRRILPVFGAHPLSNVFNQAPVLLLEGEDDERIWQQVVRSSTGRVKVYPVAVGSVSELGDYEREVARILDAVYDDAQGYSLRDRDDASSEIEDVGPVKRFRLRCRTAENLLLTDEVLASLELDWPQFRERVDRWVDANTEHPHFAAMKAFRDDGYDRIDGHLKEIRNDLVGLMGTNKPWEVLVGQAVAGLTSCHDDATANSLENFLGPEVCETLLGLEKSATEPAPP